MVSPSKIQQEHKQPRTAQKVTNQSYLTIQKGSQPLQKKSFYLDIKNHVTAAKIETKIKNLGGTIELFLVRNVSLVVSDRVDKAGYVNSEKHKWGCISGGSGGPPSLRSIETSNPMPTPPTPFCSSECPLSNSTNLRGQTGQRSKSRVDAMLERALIQPQQCSVDPLDNARSWGIPIWAVDKLYTWLDKIYASFRDATHLKRLKHPSSNSSNTDLKVHHLKGPFIKFESYHRNTRPVFLELPAWPILNFQGDPGSCPFGKKRREQAACKTIRKEVKENREATLTIKKEEHKEMTRRPRTTATRTRRSEQLESGYCGICRAGYQDLTKHVQSDQHLNFVRNDDNFLSLDTLINAGANVETFLKLNRTKDIEKDCNLFTNGDRNLHEVVLPEDKVNKNAKALEDFSVDEIKMVQCNGSPRNLNLKLNSRHNLRTRARHESGHLLRSKGSPWHEVDKSEKFYDKFEGFTIKKRSKGTIWIEEDESGDEFVGERDGKLEEYKVKAFSKEIQENLSDNREGNITCNKRNDSSNQDLHRTVIRSGNENGVTNLDSVKPQTQDPVAHRDHDRVNGEVTNGCNEHSLNVNDNGCVKLCEVSRDDDLKGFNCELQAENVSFSAKQNECDRVNIDVICNGHAQKDEQNVNGKGETGEEKLKRCSKSARRGGRSFRGRHRLSVEERLIEDNRAYYKVEVLGSKLRSSVLQINNSQCSASKDVDDEDKKEVPSQEKPVVVRFKRVRKSELSLLSDEAESFMFGEPKREESSETSDGEQSSVLPRDTESQSNDTSVNSLCSSSSLNSSSDVKSEMTEEDSQDSISLGRARKRRRTQAEALIKDNADYYKFETPGSRLRYQAPITGIKECLTGDQTEKFLEGEDKMPVDFVEKVYPSKPSPEVEKMQFSFEAVPKSEPWYQTYQRQDDGAEFWHYFSEGDSRKPFLLPYEIDNFYEILLKNQNRSDNKKKGRGRSAGCVGRSPRKSPRCHASTLAIMSTIIRKKEQQQQSSSLYTIEECPPAALQADTLKLDPNTDLKSDVDEELKEMVKTIDEMLNAPDTLDLEESFEPDNSHVELDFCEGNLPTKGAPANLLELLDRCHEIGNCLENSSCASSECGEGNVESPLKRRKKRKNRTGWPGIKLKKRLQTKPLVDAGCENLDKVRPKEERFDVQVSSDAPGRLLEEGERRLVDDQRLNFSERQDDGCLMETCTSNSTPVKRETNAELTDSYVLDGCADSELCNEGERNFSLNKEYAFGKKLSETVEISENDPGNDENHENVFRKDVNTISLAERRFITKTAISKKRQRENTSSDACESHAELENHEILCRKDSESRIVPRKHHTNGLSRKVQQKSSDNTDSELERHNSVYRRSKAASKKRIYSKRTKKNNISSDTVYEVENCKKDSYLSITCRKQANLKNVKRRADAISSEAQDSELECALSERVSPTLMAGSEVERRSSIDFQPVVRMMKIDDQVDMDHSILSVTVASNRRLRSSSFPRSNAQPPKKRLKTSRGQFGRWIKSS